MNGPLRSGTFGFNLDPDETDADRRRDEWVARSGSVEEAVRDAGRAWAEVMGDRRQREKQRRQPRKPNSFQ